jgi:hypothetical protein
MKKKSPTLEQVRELEKELARVAGKLSTSPVQSIEWLALRERKKELTARVGNAAKQIQIQLNNN